MCGDLRPYVLDCEEAGRVDLLHQSIDLVEQWMKDHGTDPMLWKALIEYAHSRGGKTMREIVGWCSRELRTLADSMDLIGWRRFMEGMISKEVTAIQRKAEDDGKSFEKGTGAPNCIRRRWVGGGGPLLA